VLSYSIADNMVLSTYDIAPFATGLIINEAPIAAQATTLVQRFDVRTSGIEHSASTLSGGNQQKVVVARELARPLNLLVAAQPTRGLDVGSIEFIHKSIVGRTGQRHRRIVGIGRARRDFGVSRSHPRDVSRRNHRRSCRCWRRPQSDWAINGRDYQYRSTGMSTPPPTPPISGWRTWGGILLVPVLAIFTALVIGAIIIVATGADVLAAYGGLFMGAIGSPRAIAYTFS
jgi:hypothetical protein